MLATWSLTPEDCIGQDLYLGEACQKFYNTSHARDFVILIQIASRFETSNCTKECPGTSNRVVYQRLPLFLSLMRTWVGKIASVSLCVSRVATYNRQKQTTLGQNAHGLQG